MAGGNRSSYVLKQTCSFFLNSWSAYFANAEPFSQTLVRKLGGLNLAGDVTYINWNYVSVAKCESW